MEFTIIGKIINTHGIKGEVKIYPLTDDIERFSDLKKVYIGDSKEEFSLKSVKYHKGFPIVGFNEFNDINQILRFKDEYVYIDDNDRIILPRDHYFIFDLVDCEVLDMSENKIGYVSDVLQNVSNDVYVVKDDVNNKEYLIPAVKEFVKDVDIANKKIMIDPIEGMIE
ncbi:MAG: ribosome maturation factor RimM [Tissierellaceae bacterium]|nr:ribosome maturation factor RimM [Tissierellaceae bacterium]